MKVSINIQSYKRAGSVNTLNIFPDANVWVHTFEVKEYRKAYPDANILELPDDTRGNLPKVKNYIFKEEKDLNDFVLFLDDDISSIGMWEGSEIVKLDAEFLHSFLIKYSLLCREWGYKLWGVNVNPDKQVYREYSPFSTLSYISSSFACFSNDNELSYDVNLPLKEDYDMTIQQCNRYRGLLRVNKFFYVKKSAENTGGCAVYRNIDKEKEQMQLLIKKWGSDIVKVDKGMSRSHSSDKIQTFDINPIIKIPINGI